MKNTVGHFIGRALKAYDVPYAAGVPGHGNWNLLDAFNDEGSDVPVIQTMHEQSAVHLADGYFRVSGKPMAVVTSIGPGSTNTIMGLANAHCNSSSLLLLSGSAATNMRSHGVCQELDRENTPDLVRITEAVTKRNFDMIQPDMAPFMMHRAFNAMLTGRPGPVHIDIPIDVQCAELGIEVQPLDHRLPIGRARADAKAIDAAIELILSAERPVIVAGGGLIASDASDALRKLVERLAIPVVFTYNGKGALPEDHPLNAGAIGWPGCIPANTLASTADVVISLGCRFTDKAASSYRRGVSFAIPSSKLIHVDIDPREIGKNYPADVGIVADVRSVLEDIDAGISAAQAQIATSRRTHVDKLAGLWNEWNAMLAPRRGHNGIPTTMLRVLEDLRKVLPRNGIVTVGSGHPESAVMQAFPIYEPRTHLTPGSYSPMGLCHPAAMGAKLARPDAPVVCIVGDGDFMMSIQELATCVAYNIPVVFLVLNNGGYISIRDGQNAIMGRNIMSEFRNHATGERYSADFCGLAKSFGFDFATRIESVDDIAPTIRRAIESNAPALIEVPITRDAAIAGAHVNGWWDFPPLPGSPQAMKDDYIAGIAAEQHRGQTTDENIVAHQIIEGA
jgi:acetolactate synthase-1/2/3 large subunit